jgi:signal transduction histidine kinase
MLGMKDLFLIVAPPYVSQRADAFSLISQEILVQLDQDGCVVAYADAAAHLLRKDCTQQGRPFAALFSPAAREQGLPQAILEACREHGVWEGVVDWTGRAGQMYVKLRVVRSPHGYLVSGLDVSDRKELEEAYFRRAVLQKALLDLASLALGTTDSAGIRREAHRIVQDALPLRTVELLLEDSPEDLECTDSSWRVEETISPSGIRCTTSMGNGPRSGALVESNDGTPLTPEEIEFVRTVVAALAGINRRLQIEQDLRRLNLDLEAKVNERTAELACAYEELKGFSYTVAHDLRAPLRAISGASMILMSDFADELCTGAVKELEAQSRAALKMARLIDDLLDHTKISWAEIESSWFSVTSLVEEVVEETLGAWPEEGIEIKIHPNMSAYGDERLIKLVLTNLIDNAIKYSDKERSLKIVVGWDDEERAFFVRDNGIGFEPQYEEKIFEPFARLHRDRDIPGTGIGLANCKRAIERHRGRLWTRSQPGIGTTFFFSLATQAREELRPLAA